MLLPSLAMILLSGVSANAARQSSASAVMQGVLNCSSRYTAIAVNEQYAIGGSGYMATTSAATVKDRFQNASALVTTNSIGTAGTPSIMILAVERTVITVMLPRRNFLNFDQEVVKAKLIVDNGRSEEATCAVKLLGGPKQAE